MNIQSPRVTVARTWRFVDENGPCVDVNASGYRRLLDLLKGGRKVDEYMLPWPAYKSRLWQHMFSNEYTETPTEDLVAGLLPRRWVTGLSEHLVSADTWTVHFEVLLHPFAVTTLVHLESAVDYSFPADVNDAYNVLRSLLRSSVDFTTETGESHRFVLMDGLSAEWLPPLPRTSISKNPITLRNAGQFTIISGTHHADGAESASALAQQFGSAPAPEDSSKLLTEDSWISVKGTSIGASFSANIRGIDRRSACAHNNFATLIAYMENLRTVLAGEATASMDWYRTKAGMMLNSLYRREPLEPFDTVQQSRVAELWIRERNLASAVNTATVSEPNVPAIPTEYEILLLRRSRWVRYASRSTR